jgi:hypothetical protein
MVGTIVFFIVLTPLVQMFGLALEAQGLETNFEDNLGRREPRIVISRYNKISAFPNLERGGFEPASRLNPA